MIANRSGTNSLATLPKPSSRFLWDTNHIMNHPTSMDSAMNGMKFESPLSESTGCSTVAVKKAPGVAPQPLKKLKYK